MEFRDLKAQYQALKNEIDAGIFKAIESTNFIGGKPVDELEGKLADYVGVKHCITCANGTEALSLVLRSWDIKEGDAVFLPDFTFFATAEVVAFEKATPVFVDVDKRTFNIDSNSLEDAIEAVIKEGKLIPKVIITVDLFGLPANYLEIEKIAKKYNLLVLEDGAQGFGGEINGRRACSFGDAATTSFFPAKPLGCYGDGGAIFTNDDKITEVIRSYKFHGKGSDKYDNVRIGVNSRLDTIQAAILLPKLAAFEKYENNDVNVIAKKYSESIKVDAVLPFIPEGYLSAWAQYTIIMPNREKRDRFMIYMKENNIPTMIYYPKGMHMQTAFKETKLYVDLSVSKNLCDCVVSIPIHPYLNDDDQNYIIEKINEWI